MRSLLLSDAMAIAAITFDADETLWDFKSVLRNALEDILRQMHNMGPPTLKGVTLDDLGRRRRELVHQHRGRSHDLVEVRRKSFASILIEHNVEGAEVLADRLIARFVAIRFGNLFPYDDVAPVLEGLKGHVRMGVLSNGNSHPDACGLPNLFDAVVLGPTYGFEKPDPLAFHTIADILAVPIRDVLHLGDGEDDIIGANAVGATSVFVNRSGKPSAFAKAAAFEITSFSELPRLLRQLGC